MDSSDQTSKIIRAARIKSLLQEPGRAALATPLMQALLAMELQRVKQEMDGIQCNLQESMSAQDGKHSEIKEQLAKLYNDRGELNTLLSEAAAKAQGTAEGAAQGADKAVQDLQALREEFNVKMTAHAAQNTKLTQDVESLVELTTRLEKRHGKSEESIKKLKSTIATEQEKVDGVREEFAKLAQEVQTLAGTLGQEQLVSENAKENVARVLRQQDELRAFFERFGARHNRFFQSLQDQSQAQFASFLATLTPDTDANTPEVPSSGLQEFVDRYEEYNCSYKRHKPKIQGHFITNFLRAIDHNVGKLIQEKLLENYPDLVNELALPTRSKTTKVVISIDVYQLTWNHIKAVLHHVTKGEVASALELTKAEGGSALESSTTTRKRRKPPVSVEPESSKAMKTNSSLA